MDQMQAPAAQAPSPVIDDMGFDPGSMLVTLINQISTKLDTDGVFDQPVSEEQAPGYHDFIKRPMCFQRMREKVHGREYRTWRGFVEDFELICSNAMIYNQRRSRVHKSALAILRAGKKWLQAAELAGRRAIAMLHPEGQAAAAAEEAREQEAAQQAAATASRLKMPGISTRRTQLMSESPMTPRASTPCQRLASLQDIPSFPQTPDVVAAPPPEAEDFQFDMHSDQDEGYSSFSETDAEEPEAKSHMSAAWLSQMGTAAAYQPWPPNIKGPGAGRLQTRRPSSAKRRLRLVECRARFLQLRLKELAGQEEHYKAELEALRQQQQQLGADDPPKAAQPAESADAPAGKQQEPAAAEAPASAPQPELKQELAAAEGILSSALPSPRHQSSLAARQGLLKSTASLGEQPSRPRRSQHKRKQERLHAPDLTPETLLRHPMFAAVAGVRNPAKVLEQTPIAESQQEHETFPACAYAALEFCERHLAALRNQLKQVPGHRQRPQKKIAPYKGRGRGSAPAARPLQTRQRSGLGLSKSGLERCSSYSKRRRNEYDVADILMSDAKYVERPKVAVISIPSVRQKSREQLEKRQAEVQTLKRRAAQPSPEAERKDDSSSGEDTSDEAFLARHQPGWEEEHRRNYAPAAGAGQRRKPKDDKGKLSRPSSGKVYSSLDALTARLPGGSAAQTPRAAETPAADARPVLAASASAPVASAQPAATVPPDPMPATASLQPLGAAAAAAVAAISKAGANPGISLGAAAITLSAAAPENGGAIPPGAAPDKGTETPSEAAKQPASKPGPAKPDGGKSSRQNGRRITTRGLAVKAAVTKPSGRTRGRGRKGGQGRGRAANGSSHAHTGGNAEGSSSEAEASGSDTTDGDAD
ncbi:g5644 [Coccomyxa viridis]|uniref:G5644 protein n=1 Tax=Coccomyxa viridis TaxID=1274662 RepID=A0ABP1FTD1_9CHLO